MMQNISLKINFEEVAYWPISTILKSPPFIISIQAKSSFPKPALLVNSVFIWFC